MTLLHLHWPMNIDSIREYCLSLPHATEDIQWEDLLFRVGGKIFAILPLEPGWMHGRVGFKCTKERCAELLEIEGIIRSPYLGRYDWVSLERFDVLRDGELCDLLRQSYELVYAKLSKKTRESLGQKKAKRARRAA
jgi:predicted DNA-binding protein (MmcQ/YjbR family)